MHHLVHREIIDTIETLEPDRTVVIAPVDAQYPIGDRVTVMPLLEFVNQIATDN